MEIWKDIVGYEDNYQISNYGNVKNKITGKILIGDKNSIGYRRVILYQPKKKRFFVHRLVALHFVDGYKENLVINHIDGNKENNHYKNLEWVTRSENDLHAFRLGLRHPNPPTYRHRIEQFDLKTNQTIKIFENIDECIEEFHIARTNIYNCCNGKQKSCRGFGFRYYES